MPPETTAPAPGDTRPVHAELDLPASADAADVAAAPAEGTDASPTRAAFEAWMARVAAEPHRFDFYQVMRHIEAAHPQLPRFGEAARPQDEPIRVAQPAELAFASRAIHALELGPGRPRLQQRIFGLLGSNGPLPIHFTELARDRLQHHGDPTLQRFLDLLTHRFALLFYRAWAQAQPALALDRRHDPGFARRLAALVGVGSEPLMGRDPLGDAPKLHFAGRLARQVRDADGLQAWCRAEFGVPLRVECWQGHWMTLDVAERTRLTARGGQGVGRGAVLGATVWDVQHKFRIVVGPLRMPRFRDFLPGGRDLARLQAMVRQWVGLEFAWDLQLLLVREDVEPVRLGRVPGHHPHRLGRTAWLGTRPHARDAGDLSIDVERVLRRRRPGGAGPPRGHPPAGTAAASPAAA